MVLRYILSSSQLPSGVLVMRPAHDAIAPGSILAFNIVFFFFPCLEKHPVSGDFNETSSVANIFFLVFWPFSISSLHQFNQVS